MKDVYLLNEGENKRAFWRVVNLMYDNSINTKKMEVFSQKESKPMKKVKVDFYYFVSIMVFPLIYFYLIVLCGLELIGRGLR